jgi:hypothetical protein
MSRNHLWSPDVIAQIQAKADLGRYLIRGLGSFKSLPSLDDLTFIPCGLTRIPLEGYRERCETRTVIGDRFAVKLSGNADSIDQLKAAVASINLAGLAALKDVGVKKG